MPLNKKNQLPIALSALFGIIASYFSLGYFHLDEHYQILEFLSYKLGTGSLQNLPWEFNAQIRPWVQPFVYFLMAKFFSVFGQVSPLLLERVLRLLSVVLFQYSLWKLYTYIAKEYLESENEKKFYKWFMALFWVFPFIAARISSEAVGGSLFFIGLIGTLEALKDKKLLSIALNSFFIGLAVWIRFQIGAAVLGFLIWYIVFSKSFQLKSFVTIALGGLCAIAIGVLIDYWGYGQWVITPVKYFSRNILEGEAAKHGVTPWWEYFYVAQKKLHPGVGIVFVVATLYFWVKKFKDVFGMTAICFFLMHMLTSHKELRFLIPLAWLLPFYMIFMLKDMRAFEKIPSKVKRPLAILFLSYLSFGSVVSATKSQYQGVELLNFLKRENLAKIYTFSSIPLKMMTHNIEQSFYGEITTEEVLVKDFSEVHEVGGFFVAARGGHEALIFQKNNCQQVFPNFSWLYFKLHYARKFYKQDFYSIYQCHN